MERFPVNQFSESDQPFIQPSPISPHTSSASASMRRLIRSRRTQAFLTRQGAWTCELAKAAAFDNSATLLEAVRRFELHDVETYYSFHEHQPSQWDFAIPVR